jgi:molybdopterin molybdotransferase
MTLVEPRWDDARTLLAERVRGLDPVRRTVSACAGLVLAEDLVALCDLPSFDTSAMDGWAVGGPGPWTIVGQSLAGRPVPGPLDAGQAVVIATGGVVPPGADAVVRSEDGHLSGGAGAEVLIAPAPEGRTHVRPAGEECARGEVLAPAGTVITPALVGLAAACGHDDLMVVPRPRVALVLFGDELATHGIPAQGLVRDSLGPQVPAWVARMGGDVVLVERAEDTLTAHVEAIGRAAGAADLVLTTGGTAAGPVDHLHEAIALCSGEVVIDSVAVRPGHPMLAATVGRGRTWLVGLPGNPQSAIVTLMSLGAPVLAALSGRPALAELAEVPCSEAVPAPTHEDRLVPGCLVGGEFVPGSHLGSGMLRGLAAATGFAVLPPGGVAAGDPVRWLPLPR